jgi:hypothetical protein
MSRGPRPHIQATSREEPREAGFYVRPVGFDADVDIGGRAAYRIARVKVDQFFDEGSGVQYEQPEMEEMPELVEDSEDDDTVEEGMTTRGQVARRVTEEKRKSADTNTSEAMIVQLAEGLMENQAKKQRMDQLDQMDTKEMVKEKDCVIRTIGPKRLNDRELSAWAWGTGSAEEFQGEEQEEAWENHGDNEKANYVRKKDVLKRVGLEPMQYDPVTIGHLLQYHLWPGPREMDMSPLAAIGTEKEAHLMNEYRLFEEAEDAKARMSYLKEMCRTKHQIGKELQDGMNEHDVRMH